MLTALGILLALSAALNLWLVYRLAKENWMHAATYQAYQSLLTQLENSRKRG